MNKKDLKRAKIGDRVAFKPLPADAGDYAEGTITDLSPSKNKCTVLWDDGERGIVTNASYDRIHLMQMELPFQILNLDDPAEVHNAIADAIGEPRLKR